MTETASVSLAYAPMLTALGGGLALFLYGMRKLTDALKTVAGEGMKTLLARLTTNRFSAAAAGALVTAVIQSSSVTTVMVVSFVSAGVMSFSQSIGIILGANIGTTITAQIIAFKITSLALLLIGTGFLTEVLARTRRVQQVGVLIMGLGMLFFGMQLMGDATAPLRVHAPFIEAMQDLRNPLISILAGALFTAVVQSSSATTGIVIVLASQGFIPLEAGVALVLGANVGTCVTVMLAAIGRPREAVKAAVVHVLFNVSGVLLLVGFIPQFADLVRSVSPLAPGLDGAARLAAEVPRQIANAHTLFNIAVTLLFLGFTGTLARLVERLVPRAEAGPEDPGHPRHLQPMYLEHPGVALDQVKLELEHMGELVTANVTRALPLALTGDEPALQMLAASDESIDHLHGEILDYAGRIGERDLVEPLPRRLQRYIGVANYLENMGDVVETGLVPVGLKRLEIDRPMDADMREALLGLHQLSLATIEQALTAFAEDDPLGAQAVRESKNELNRKSDALRLRLARKLAGGDRAGIGHYRLATECIDGLKRLHTLARRIARLVLEGWEEERARSGPAPGMEAAAAPAPAVEEPPVGLDADTPAPGADDVAPTPVSPDTERAPDAQDCTPAAR